MLDIAQRYLEGGTLKETDMTVKAMKEDIRVLNDSGVLTTPLPLTGTKGQLRSNINEALMSWHTEETKNRSSTGFAECVNYYTQTAAHRAPGTANLYGVNAKIIIGHTSTWSKAIAPVMEAIAQAKPEYADETGKISRSVGFSHAVVQATDAKKEGTTEAGLTMHAAWHGVDISGDTEIINRVADMFDEDAGKTRNDDGLFTAQIVDRLVKEIQERAPEGYTIGAITEGLTFDSFILYDYSVAPKSVDDARFPPSGMFKLEWNTKRVPRGEERRYLADNPPAQAFLNQTFGYYQKNTHRWFADVCAFRIWVLSGFNLLPLATPYDTVARQVKGFKGKETKYVPYSQHGITRNKGIAAVMMLEELDFNFCRKQIASMVGQSIFDHTVEWHSFIPGSPTDIARNADRNRAKKLEESWFKGGKKGKRPRGPPNLVPLTPDNVKDLKKLEIIKVWVDLCAMQGDSASMMNMIASEERQVEAGSGIMPNIVRMLKFVRQGRTLSADETSFIENLQTLREHSLSKPWAWVDGVRGTSSGVTDDTNLPAWARTNSNRRKTKGKGKLNFAGKYGHNHGCLQLEMTTFAGEPCIGMYVEDLTPEAISNREKFGHKKHRTH